MPSLSDRWDKWFWTFIVAVVGAIIGRLALSMVREVSAQSPGVCDRTRQVQTAIVAATGAGSCSQVTTMLHLREITSLDLSSQGISSLSEGDFDGLVRLKALVRPVQRHESRTISMTHPPAPVEKGAWRHD